ncbi:hypothetical protein Bhyg_06040 [Pseudolycoriella hygida]|uniref:F-box domain-containing protein n=1 Tax=Pseudolycoriella hygida TaxID=35572 RepID=A0A9Q0N003_9DIPT|nr:hypothetical protein Bhyg_06040 [Pseudolycoriella hygida]
MQMNTMDEHPLDIPLICDKICRYLPVRDLVTCRSLNKLWNGTVARTLAKRDEETRPKVKLTFGNINHHLRFLANRNRPMLWIRTYHAQLKVANRSVLDNFERKANLLWERHGHPIFSVHMDMIGLMYYDTEYLYNSVFVRKLFLLRNLRHLTLDVNGTFFQHFKAVMHDSTSLRSIKIDCVGEIEPLVVILINSFLETPEWPSLERFILNISNRSVAIKFADYFSENHPNVYVEINP